MVVVFGPDSPVFLKTTEMLSRIFSRAGQIPSVAARFREWQRSQISIHGPDSASEDRFIQQTYLALLARFIARRFVAPGRPISNDEELLEIINTAYFSRRGIGNFGEGDFFSWIPLDPRWHPDQNAEVLEIVRALSEALAPFDFSHTTSGVLDELYRQQMPYLRSVPRWLAEYTVIEELRLAEDASLSFLDPGCGTGVFLTAAIGSVSRTMADQGSDSLDVLFALPQTVQGMDGDPLAVALARLNYLLAMGGLVQQQHPPFLLPVYQADAATIPGSSADQTGEIISTVATTAGEFPLPSPMIDNPAMLDWILGRLTNYMDGAQLRLHVQSEDEAVQEVMNAYYNYLTSTKPRTPVPEALTPRQADILLETASLLVRLHIRGEGTLWLHRIQNAAAPTIFSRRGFDRLATSGAGPLLDSPYLKPDGRKAMILIQGEAEKRSAGLRLVDLRSVLPDSALLVTGPQQRAKLVVAAGLVPDNSPWNEAKAAVRVVPENKLG